MFVVYDVDGDIEEPAEVLVLDFEFLKSHYLLGRREVTEDSVVVTDQIGTIVKQARCDRMSDDGLFAFLSKDDILEVDEASYCIKHFDALRACICRALVFVL